MDVKALRKEIEPPARFGVGLWVMPQVYVGKERDLAVRLDADVCDARTVYLQTLPSGSRFSGLTQPGRGAQRLYQAIYDLCHKKQSRTCLLVHTLDLLVFGLSDDERAKFWTLALDIPYPRTRLILTLPEASYDDLVSLPVRERFASRIAQGGLEQP